MVDELENAKHHYERFTIGYKANFCITQIKDNDDEKGIIYFV